MWTEVRFGYWIIKVYVSRYRTVLCRRVGSRHLTFLLVLCFLVFLWHTLSLNSFLGLLLFLFLLSLQHVTPFLFLCLCTPHLLPSSPPFSLLPSWQRCQSGLADRGKHSTGQSRGWSKGWWFDYVYVCVLNSSVVGVFSCLTLFWLYATDSNASLLLVCFGPLCCWCVWYRRLCVYVFSFRVCVTVAVCEQTSLCHLVYGQTHSRQ